MASILRLEGQQFGEYRLLRWLGRGGHAGVYLGEHIHIRMQCAVKVFPIEDTSEDFVKEARRISYLDHPHIVRIYHFWIDTEHALAFLAMDYAAGGTLRRQHPRGSLLPLNTILTYVDHWISPSARTRSAAHSSGRKAGEHAC